MLGSDWLYWRASMPSQHSFFFFFRIRHTLSSISLWIATASQMEEPTTSLSFYIKKKKPCHLKWLCLLQILLNTVVRCHSEESGSLVSNDIDYIQQWEDERMVGGEAKRQCEAFWGGGLHSSTQMWVTVPLRYSFYSEVEQSGILYTRFRFNLHPHKRAVQPLVTRAFI